MVWISVLYVVGALQFYSVLESKRCLAAKPDTVESTNKLSTLTVWNTTAYTVNMITDPAMVLLTLAFDKKVIINRGYLGLFIRFLLS